METRIKALEERVSALERQLQSAEREGCPGVDEPSEPVKQAYINLQTNGILMGEVEKTSESRIGHSDKQSSQ